jgi:hypothetical protein
MMGKQEKDQQGIIPQAWLGPGKEWEVAWEEEG